MDIVIFVITCIVGIVSGFFGAYLSEKGKNFATKEDIAHITEEQAKVHSQYDAKIETLRSDLQKQLHIHNLSFEKEFKILSELWNCSVNLRDSIPVIPPLFTGTKDEVEQHQRQVFLKFDEKLRTFRDIFEKKRPFYPQEIYEIAVKLSGTANVNLDFTINYNSQVEHLVIWKQTHDEIIQLTEELCNAIRKQLEPNGK